MNAVKVDTPEEESKQEKGGSFVISNLRPPLRHPAPEDSRHFLSSQHNEPQTSKQSPSESESEKDGKRETKESKHQREKDREKTDTKYLLLWRHKASLQDISCRNVTLPE